LPRLLTIGHSYVIAGNRRLAHEMAVQGRGRWEVTAVAPEWLPADLRRVRVEAMADEACALRTLRLALPSSPHLRFYRGLRAVLGGSWDVVHVWEEPYVAACAQIASRAPAATRVVPSTFQNIVKSYPPPFSLFERRVLDRAAGWIAFGETAHEAQRGKPMYAGRPSRVIAPGVDACRFRPLPGARDEVLARLGWDGTVPIVGFLGRFVPEKGLATLMSALERVSGSWRALFVGAGPMKAGLETFAAAHRDRVRVVTAAAHDEVPAYLNAMDLLCAPSETTPRWREQFGRMLIEAMATGVPVVASRSGEIPHVVGDAGVLVEERQPSDWARAIERLLADPGARTELTARAQARVHDRFALPVVARAHLSFFEELL
jgi:glycosyltransferase involved in cell wall biosynthesis